MMRVVLIPQFSDNYAYLVIDEASATAAVVDVAEPEPVLAAAAAEDVRIVAILCTHHHFDHIGGNEALIAALADGDLEVFGYAGEAERIPGLTTALEDGQELEIGALRGQAIFIPAHTSGHVAYYFAAGEAVFTGDTLFAGGCGRIFEGDAAQMKASLERLAALPDRTAVYCGHEYTESNLAFAATLEPNNAALTERCAEVKRLRAEGKPTVPTTIALEKATNPFLRSDSAELGASVERQVGGLGGDQLEIFAATRRLKDNF